MNTGNSISQARIVYTLLLTGLCCTPEISKSQNIYNGTSLHLNHVNIYVEGSITNKGTLINNGFISFTKDWDNRSTYAGNGVLYLKGNTPQIIAHNDQNVNTLMIHGGGTKTIKGHIHITDEFHLTKGIVKVSDRDTLSLENDAMIFGGSRQSFVDGPLTATGKGYKFFPVGKDKTYAPIELLNVKNNSATYSIEVFENPPLAMADNIEINYGLYWYRKDIRGKFSGSALAVNFEPTYFSDPDKLIILIGEGWETPFRPVTDLAYSGETNQLSTQASVTSPIIILGEMVKNRSEYGFYFSTALSPNAANPENRKVKIFGERFKEENFRFEVYNRWGSIVYQNTSLEGMSDNGWDGRKLNGDALMAGPYPYKIDAVDKAGKRFEKRGVISIIY